MEQYLTLLEPWYKAIAVFIGFTIIRLVYKFFIKSILHRVTNILNLLLAEDVLNSFEKPINCMLWICNFYCALRVSPLNITALGDFLNHLMRSCFIFCFFWGVYNVTYTSHLAFTRLQERLGLRNEPTIANLFSTSVHILVVLMGFAAIAKEWSYDITGFLASLSIGSVALAFAAKDALANVFGSIVIILDKPFKVGDWIVVDGTEGVVENISFRSTRLRTFANEVVYIPNNMLSNTHIKNFTKREKTRLDFKLGFTYNTSKEYMEKALAGMREYLMGLEYVYPETVEVNFQDYNSSSLDVRVICYLKTPDARTYREYQGLINTGLLEIIKEAGVTCAFPTRSVYIENK